MNTIKWIHKACVSKRTLCYNHNENTFFSITSWPFPAHLTPTLAVSCYFVTSLGIFTVDATVFLAVITVTITRAGCITIMCTIVTAVTTATVSMITLPTIATVWMCVCTIWTKRIVSALLKEKKKTIKESFGFYSCCFSSKMRICSFYFSKEKNILTLITPLSSISI